MDTQTRHIPIQDYDYPLPDAKIAKFPLARSDESKLLLYRNGQIGESVFKRIGDFLPPRSLMVFNNTKVIQARLPFRKATGAQIEVFCLEPVSPADYVSVFGQTERCTWTCLVGNSKKWKDGVLAKEISIGGETIVLQAERKQVCGESNVIEFGWNNPAYTFADLLEAGGVLPIPPYLHRETEASDLKTYQTVYSKIKGSVAAPTAGLHFTEEVLAGLEAQGIGREELTLHVGAGTFKPVKSDTIGEHEMHTEFISVRRPAVRNVLDNLGHVIAVGTTSVRTLESLYYIGVLLEANPDASAGELRVSQWMPYDEANNRLPVAQALQNILAYLDRNGADQLVTSTQILIAPGYTFKIVTGMVTNFHQPKSTLLLLISAFLQGNWKPVYEYALSHGFRFLSYGDSSLLLGEGGSF
ncbi:MAG: S-adenosylmethionine:tRNA ribosyltransferase-isomerase [Parabacteroides sp.]|nr:S-adenosylmethionine:tRNA ribosyltransferase-isomerase [Parabacteroides sp.]